MAHHHAHGHDHGHHHQPANYGKAFAIGIVLNVVFVLVEVAFGIASNSLALLADAGHNLSDVLGLLVAWGGNWLAQWRPTDRHTYGFRKASVLAALINALLLLVAIGGIVWEAIGRLNTPVASDATTIIWVAAVGIVINTATALLFVSGRKSDLNVRGAFLHMAADAAISAGVVIAGIAIAMTQIELIDPVISIVIAAIIFIGTWGLLRESLNLTLDAVPEQINPKEVAEFLSRLPNVTDIHHLHIWGLSTRDTALTAHLVLAEPDNNDALLARIRDELLQRFEISHATIQFESEGSGICLTRRCSLHTHHGKSHDA